MRLNISSLKALAERLREESIDKDDPLWNHPLLGEAADSIDALILAVEDARTALQPLADAFDYYEKQDGGSISIMVPVARCRAARDWLAKAKL